MPYQNNGAPRYNNGPRAGGGYDNRGGWGGNRPQTGGTTTGTQARGRNINDVSTDGALLFNDKVGKFLRTRFWNRYMSIDIGTFAPGTPIDGNLMRNAQTFGGTFGFSTLYELYEICEEIKESIKQTNQFESTAIEGNQKKDTIVEISNGSNINMPAGIYLVIYKSVDAGKRTNQLDFYPFGSTKVMRNYDHNTGSSKEDVKLTSEFKKFTMMLKEAVKGFTMAQAHAAKEASKQDKNSSIAMLTAISASLGVDVTQAVAAATSYGNRTTGQSSYQRQGGSGGGFQRSSQPGQWSNYGHSQNASAPTQNGFQGAQQAPTPATNEPVDIMIDANTLQHVTMEDFK